MDLKRYLMNSSTPVLVDGLMTDIPCSRKKKQLLLLKKQPAGCFGNEQR